MNKNSFLSDLLQNIGFVSAIAVALSQYALNDSFKVFFLQDNQVYKSSSLVALIISIALILGIFVLRNKLSNPIILFFWENKKYKNELSKVKDSINKFIFENGIEAGEQYKKTISWPNYPKTITSVGFGFVFIIFALIVFVLLINFHEILWIGSSLFVCFISFSVIAISLFSIEIYRENEYKNQRSATTEEIFNRINEFFSDKVTVISDYQDVNNFVNPIRTIIVEHPKKGKYRIDCNSYDPSKLFSIMNINNELETNQRKK